MTEQPKSWRDVIKVHPAADMFPMMTADEKKVLGEDIKKNRLHERVTLYGNLNAVETWQLLDGRNRLDAMELVGLPVFVENGEIRNELWAFRRDDQVDPYEFVISANVHRRHLTPEQKRDLIAKLLKAQPSKSNRTIAKQTKADHKTVGAMRDKLEARGEIPHVSTVEDTKGRKQPSSKKRHDIEDRVGTDATSDEPAQAEGAFPIYGSCAGGRVVTERTSTKAKADRAAVKQPTPMPDVTAAADRAEGVRGDVAKPREVIRGVFLNHAAEALRHAHAVAWEASASPQEMTDDFIEAALRTARAWSALVTTARKAQRGSSR